MTTKRLCLCLILVLLSTWASRLMAGSFLVAPGRGNASFGQEVYPLSMQDRAENRETVEAPPLAKLANSPLPACQFQPMLICSGLEGDIVLRLYSGISARYIFMSLQP
jgi:hypothetical protein